MYYSYTCSVCGKVFYMFSENKQSAAQVLYNGISKHIIEYKEDHMEKDFFETPEKEIYKLYYNMKESGEVPYGGYELE